MTQPTQLSPDEIAMIKRIPARRHSTGYLIAYHQRLALKYMRVQGNLDLTRPTPKARAKPARRS